MKRGIARLTSQICCSEVIANERGSLADVVQELRRSNRVGDAADLQLLSLFSLLHNLYIYFTELCQITIPNMCFVIGIFWKCECFQPYVGYDMDVRPCDKIHERDKERRCGQDDGENEQ